jgi:hypothetical protein
MYSIHSLNHFLEVSLREGIHSLPISIHSISTASRYSYQSDNVPSLDFPALVYTVYSYCIFEALLSTSLLSLPLSQDTGTVCVQTQQASPGSGPRQSGTISLLILTSNKRQDGKDPWRIPP